MSGFRSGEFPLSGVIGRLRQIGATLGKVIDIDWNSQFSSYFEMIRVKIACKNQLIFLLKE
uniref:Uncharacterized protein n=1 Tax=Arundo donax TaxID=35708 RepID=A0A0A8YLQ2_ARUDO